MKLANKRVKISVQKMAGNCQWRLQKLSATHYLQSLIWQCSEPVVKWLNTDSTHADGLVVKMPGYHFLSQPCSVKQQKLFCIYWVSGLSRVRIWRVLAWHP